MADLSSILGGGSKPPLVYKWTATGTFVLPTVTPNGSGEKWILVRHMIGGGGGGGGRDATYGVPGGSGEHGLHLKNEWIEVTSYAEAYTFDVAIGAAGTLGASGNNDGTDGGVTTLKDRAGSPVTIISAAGGPKGLGASYNSGAPQTTIPGLGGTSQRAGFSFRSKDAGRGAIPDIPGQYGRGGCGMDSGSTSADYAPLAGYLEIHVY